MGRLGAPKVRKEGSRERENEGEQMEKPGEKTQILHGGGKRASRKPRESRSGRCGEKNESDESERDTME